MSIPSYPTDRASIVARGLVNMRGQVKNIEKDLAWTQERVITARAVGNTQYLQEHLIREANLTDVLRVLALYIELGEQEVKRLSKQPSLFAESEVAL